MEKRLTIRDLEENEYRKQIDKLKAEVNELHEWKYGKYVTEEERIKIQKRTKELQGRWGDLSIKECAELLRIYADSWRKLSNRERAEGYDEAALILEQYVKGEKERGA